MKKLGRLTALVSFLMAGSLAFADQPGVTKTEPSMSQQQTKNQMQLSENDRHDHGNHYGYRDRDDHRRHHHGDRDDHHGHHGHHGDHHDK